MKECDSKTVLVSGASGLLGSAILSRLDERAEVIAICRSKPVTGRHLVTDLSSNWSLSQLPQRVDTVIHLAQSEKFRNFPTSAKEVFDVNVVSLQRLLDYAKRARAERFIIASSGGVYGFGEKPFAEEMEVRQRGDLGFYLGTKICAEILAENYSSFFKVIVLRFFFIYGPRQRRDMLMPRLAQSVRKGRPIQLQGAEGIRTNPVYVDDAAASVMTALDLDESQRINVAGAEVLSLRQIAEVLGEAVGREPCFEVDAKAESRHLVGDISRMRALLGAPKVSFAEGIRRMLDTGTA